MIQKVSAVYGGGISKAQRQAWMPKTPKYNLAPVLTTHEEVSQTALSKKLSPPPKPSFSDYAGCGLVSLIAVGGVGFFVGFLLTGNALIAIAFTVAAVIGVAAWLAKKEEAEKRNYDQAMERYNRAMPVWERLYYCGRDDIVFDPDTGESVPADSMNELLYR